MNRETIEKAANARYEDNTFSYKGFIAGAEWRINSVWHDTSEKPKFKGKVEKSIFLVLRKSGQCGLIQVSKDDWEDVLELMKFIKWADVTDLMPENE